MSVTLRKFIPFSPEEILSGPYGEWILLLILIGLFCGVAASVLPRHLTERRAGQAVVIFTGIMLGLGLFQARRLYNFNLESLGFLSIFIIIFLASLILFGLLKTGMAKSTAVSITYCVMFLSFFLLSPSLFDAIAEAFPLVNLIFVILFFYMLGKPLFGMFGSNNPLKAARKIQKNTNFGEERDVEIDREKQEDKAEISDIRKKTMPVNRKELRSVTDIGKALNDIIKTIQVKKGQFTGEDKNQISEDLTLINRHINLLEKAIEFIYKHVEVYERVHKRDTSEVQQRLQKTTSTKQKQVLKEELYIHQQMTKVLNYIEHFKNSKEKDFIHTFKSLISQAMNRLAENKPAETLSYLETARKNLAMLNLMLNRVKALEKWVLKSDKKIVKDLKKEKKAKNQK